MMTIKGCGCCSGPYVYCSGPNLPTVVTGKSKIIRQNTEYSTIIYHVSCSIISGNNNKSSTICFYAVCAIQIFKVFVFHQQNSSKYLFNICLQDLELIRKPSSYGHLPISLIFHRRRKMLAHSQHISYLWVNSSIQITVISFINGM